jgi:hypothetical protein
VSAVEQGSQPRWRSRLPLWAPLILGAGVVWAFMLASSWPSPSEDEAATVVKVCHDGTLVLKREDGEFRLVRPGALRGWRAASDKVCEP